MSLINLVGFLKCRGWRCGEFLYKYISLCLWIDCERSKQYFILSADLILSDYAHYTYNYNMRSLGIDQQHSQLIKQYKADENNRKQLKCVDIDHCSREKE